MFSRYYRYGGEPMHFAAQWTGLPPSSPRRGNLELSDANFYESAAPVKKMYRPLAKAVRNYLREEERQVSLSDVASGYGPPLRESGPEPLDPGAMPHWDDAYQADRLAMPVGDVSITFPTSIPGIGAPSSQVAPPKKPGIFSGMSGNTKLLLIGAAAAGGYMLLRHRRGGKRKRR